MSLPKHESFKNYLTWNVNLWLSNDKSCYRYWISRTREIHEAAKKVAPSEDLHRKVVIALVSELQGTFEDYVPVATGVYADLLGWALRFVDSCEVAEQFLEE